MDRAKGGGKRLAIVTGMAALAIAGLAGFTFRDDLSRLYRDACDRLFMSREDLAVKERIGQPCVVAFPSGTSFLEALQVLSQLGDVNFVLTHDANAIVLSEHLDVDLPPGPAAPLAEVLDRLCACSGAHRFTYRIRTGKIVIGPRDDPVMKKIEGYRIDAIPRR